MTAENFLHKHYVFPGNFCVISPQIKVHKSEYRVPLTILYILTLPDPQNNLNNISLTQVLSIYNFATLIRNNCATFKQFIVVPFLPVLHNLSGCYLFFFATGTRDKY